MLIVGFGSVGQGSLPLILRHIDIKPEQITIITANAFGREIAGTLVSQGFSAVREIRFTLPLAKR